MKKRAMKKWIPKNTPYCYSVKNNKTIPCKWYNINLDKDSQECGYCKYLNCGDWYKNGTSLLFDMDKECGIGDE